MWESSESFVATCRDERGVSGCNEESETRERTQVPGRVHPPVPMETTTLALAAEPAAGPFEEGAVCSPLPILVSSPSSVRQRGTGCARRGLAGARRCPRAGPATGLSYHPAGREEVKMSPPEYPHLTQPPHHPPSSILNLSAPSLLREPVCLQPAR